MPVFAQIRWPENWLIFTPFYYFYILFYQLIQNNDENLIFTKSWKSTLKILLSENSQLKENNSH